MTAMVTDCSPRIDRRAVRPVRPAGDGVMHGRDAELRVVRDLLRRAQRGRGGVLLVDGEQGMGKSRLLGESVQEAAGLGFSLAAGAADQLSRAIPFFALYAVLREPPGPLAPGDYDQDLPDTPAWWIGRLRAHLEQRAIAGPVLVALDDLHWASPATLAVLGTLARELKRHRIAWIFARSSTRPPEAGSLFSALERDGATRIALAPLGGDAVADLLTDAFGVPPDEDLLALASGAAGNPSLLTALIRGLRDDGAVRVTGGHAALISSDLPERVHVTAEQRLEPLTGRARHLLATAAVLGSSFRLDDTAEMLGQAPATLLPAVDEAMSAGIVTAAEDAFRFRHELIRRATAEMIPAPARTALHRQYAQILLSRGEPAALAAGHLLQAARPGDPAALAGLDQAAEQILPSSPQAAAGLAVRALELTRPADPAALPRTAAAAEALAAAGRAEDAARIAGDALARPLPPVLEARLRCVRSWVLCTRGQDQDASAEAALALAQSELPGHVRDQAVIAQLQAAGPTAGRLAGSVLASAGAHGDQVVAAARVTCAMISWDNGQISQALDFLREAARHGGGSSADARHAQPLLALAAALIDLRRPGDAAGVLRAAGHEKLCGVPAEAIPPLLRARIHLAQGQLAEADADAEAALATAETLGAHGLAGAARAVLAVIALRRGDIAAAAGHITPRPAPVPAFAGLYARAETALAHAQITEARHGPAAALPLIRDTAAGLAAHPGLLAADPAAAAWLTRTALAAGDDQLAARTARAAAALARGNPGFPALAAAAAHSQGLVDRDPERLAQAAARHPGPWARASAAEDLAVQLAATAGQDQDQDQAVGRLTQALDGYTGAGAAADAARIRRRLRGHGIRRRHWARPAGRPVTGWHSLTQTETSTALLVAQGLNNQQIASRMYISANTVACHLRQIFRKLNIGSRVQLARIVIEQQES